MSMKLLTHILLTALTLLLVSRIIPGIEVDNLYAAIVASLILGLLNLFVKPILVILTLPITILTLGFFMFVINASLFLFAASFIQGFRVDGFLTALIGSLVVSIVSSLAGKLLV